VTNCYSRASSFLTCLVLWVRGIIWGDQEKHWGWADEESDVTDNVE